MPVKYPERINDTKHPVCECGHFDFDHNGFQPTPLNCNTCMCPRFMQETTMTYDEMADKYLESLGLKNSKQQSPNEVKHE